MFTGIVQASCEVVNIIKNKKLHTIELAIEASLREGLCIGASVATNGVCLTVTKISDDRVFFDVMEETLKLTNLSSLSNGDRVNVERSLTFGGEIGGHLLSGHVQTLAQIIKLEQETGRYVISLAIDKQWRDYIFNKGFIGVNGCSLTVGKLTQEGCEVYLIPETLKLTNLSERVVGDELNIEIDSQTQVIVDTVTRIMAAREQN